MSYGSFKGKLVWGSSVYRIDILMDSKRLTNDLSGTLIFYERRHEVSTEKFKSLTEFITSLNQMWETALNRAGVQDTRLARWIEEYLIELGLSVSYKEILDAIRGEFEEVPALEVISESELDKELISNYITPRDDIQINGVVKKIKGDFSDKREMSRTLNQFLHENKPERKITSKSQIKFLDKTNKDIEIENQNKIYDLPLSNEVILRSKFINNYGSEISNAELKDIIPYDYEIVDIVPSKDDLEKISQELSKEGVVVKWNIKKLSQKEEVNIEYTLTKRMLRTILIRDDNDLTILNTYENIKSQDNDIWVESNYNFISPTDKVENVRILDQLPSELKFVSSQPQITDPISKLNTTPASGTEIEWNYEDVPSQTQFTVTYELEPNPQIFRDQIKLLDKDDELCCEITKVVKPLKHQNGYGVIFALLAHKNISTGLVLEDEINKNFKISNLENEIGNIEIEDGQNKNKIKWKIENLPLNKTFMSYNKYIGEGNLDLGSFKLFTESGSIELLNQEDTFLKEQEIVMPFVFNDKIDIK